MIEKLRINAINERFASILRKKISKELSNNKYSKSFSRSNEKSTKKYQPGGISKMEENLNNSAVEFGLEYRDVEVIMLGFRSAYIDLRVTEVEVEKLVKIFKICMFRRTLQTPI